MFHVEHEVEIKKLLSEGGIAVGCPLQSEQIENFHIYFNELRSWNQKVNLTGLTEELDIVVTLFIDSLACGIALSDEKNESVIDIGSGAGFPGIPLKIAYPKLGITLVEPRLKKTAFLHHIIGRLSLENIHVISRPIQEYCHDLSFDMLYDKVVARAIKTDSILPIAGSLLNQTGKVVLCRSKPLDTSVSSLGMALIKEFHYTLPNGYGNRVLSVLAPIT